MENCECEKIDCKNTCVIEVIISIVLGVLFGILYSTGVVGSTLNFIKIALAMSGISMAILGGSLFTANLLKRCNIFEKCICRLNKCLVVSTIGTVLAATATATIGIVYTSVFSIIAAALTMFFFIWMIVSISSLFNCLIKGTCK